MTHLGGGQRANALGRHLGGGRAAPQPPLSLSNVFSHFVKHCLRKLSGGPRRSKKTTSGFAENQKRLFWLWGKAFCGLAPDGTEAKIATVHTNSQVSPTIVKGAYSQINVERMQLGSPTP